MSAARGGETAGEAGGEAAGGDGGDDTGADKGERAEGSLLLHVSHVTPLIITNAGIFQVTK